MLGSFRNLPRQQLCKRHHPQDRVFSTAHLNEGAELEGEDPGAGASSLRLCCTWIAGYAPDCSGPGLACTVSGWSMHAVMQSESGPQNASGGVHGGTSVKVVKCVTGAVSDIWVCRVWGTA